MWPCLISAKEPAVYSLSSVQNDMPEQPTASQKPGLRPSDEPSARSISSSRADQVATDERATDTATKAAHVATTNVPAIARDRGPTARPRSAPGSLGCNRLTKICKQTDIRQQKVAVMPFLIFLKNACTPHDDR